jgi:thiamine biosynthesis protein ThiS
LKIKQFERFSCYKIKHDISGPLPAVSRSFLVDLAKEQSVSFKVMPGSITVEINGAPRTVPTPVNVSELLEHLGVGPDRLAVELNRRVLMRKEWDSTPLSDKDKIEIVQFVGGG